MIARHVRRLAKALRLVRNPTYRGGLLQGVAAAIEHEGSIRALQVATLVDVGANVGQFSLLVRALHPRSVIHAFEPLPAMAARYRRLFENDAHVTLYQVAAGERGGTARFHVSKRPDSSSLLPITARQERVFPGTGLDEVAHVQVARVDDLVSARALVSPILVKLDVQGGELAALKGMPALLEVASFVYAELSFVELYDGQPLAHELIQWLSARNFRCTGIYNLTCDAGGRAVQSDALFTRGPMLGDAADEVG